MKQIKKFNWINIIMFISILLLLIIAINGVLSFSITNKYEVKNLYGDIVEIFGSGIYKNDSFFKAPIFIGTDAAILLIVVPIMIKYLIREINTLTQKINIFAIFGIVMYYALSISFGVVYNRLQLIYIFLVVFSFFPFFILLFQIYGDVKNYKCKYKTSKGELTFLILTGTSLFVAWLPDIISSLTANTSLKLIEIYNTEVTYVLDMGIVSPLIFIIIYLLQKQSFIGLVLYHMVLVTLKIIGIMLPMQTLFQLLAGVKLPLPVLISKVIIFVILSLFSIYFDRIVMKRIKQNIINNS